MFPYPGNESKTSSHIVSLIVVWNKPPKQKCPERSSHRKRSSNPVDIKWVPTGMTIDDDNEGNNCNSNSNSNDLDWEEGGPPLSDRVYNGASLFDLCPRTSNPGLLRNGRASTSLWLN
jgi:hypothetical protein